MKLRDFVMWLAVAVLVCLSAAVYPRKTGAQTPPAPAAAYVLTGEEAKDLKIAQLQRANAQQAAQLAIVNFQNANNAYLAAGEKVKAAHKWGDDVQLDVNAETPGFVKRPEAQAPEISGKGKPPTPAAK